MKTSLGIGITTKNRWNDLAFTLARIEEFWGGKYEILVIDDGSDSPPPDELLREFPRVRFERSEQSLGMTIQRNRIAHLLGTEYILSLDDDSYPIEGSIEDSIDWMRKDPSIFALSYTTIENGCSHPLLDQLPKEPCLCKYYFGCSHLLNRKMFLELGGYNEVLMIYAEEFELALRALKAGKRVIYYPEVYIRHNPSTTRMPSSGKRFLHMRNEILTGFVSYPFFYLLIRCSWYPAQAWLTGKDTFQTCSRATLAAFRMAHQMKRNPLTYKEYRDWKQLPLPTYLM